MTALSQVSVKVFWTNSPGAEKVNSIADEKPCADLGGRWVSAVRHPQSTRGVSADRAGEPVVNDESDVVFPFC